MLSRNKSGSVFLSSEAPFLLKGKQQTVFKRFGVVTSFGLCFVGVKLDWVCHNNCKCITDLMGTLLHVSHVMYVFIHISAISERPRSKKLEICGI